MKVTITKDDTIQTLYEKARSKEREFLDAHYRETGILWPGRVCICFELPANLRHYFMKMLVDSGTHVFSGNYKPDSLFGLPVFTVAALEERT